MIRKIWRIWICNKNACPTLLARWTWNFLTDFDKWIVLNFDKINPNKFLSYLKQLDRHYITSAYHLGMSCIIVALLPWIYCFFPSFSPDRRRDRRRRSWVRLRSRRAAFRRPAPLNRASRKANPLDNLDIACSFPLILALELPLLLFW